MASCARVLVLAAICLAGFARIIEGATPEGEVEYVPGTIHTVISTECSRYFSFQNAAMSYSHRRVQPGPLTRIASCDSKSLEEYVEEDMNLMDTHFTPSYATNPKTGDYYPPFNKPLGVLNWLEQRKPTEEWTLIVDADSIFRQPFIPESFDLKENQVMSAHYGYMLGGENGLADMHIPEVPKKNNTYGGNRGRRADQAGAFYLIRTKDLIRVAPLWFQYTEDVRENPRAWNLTGDVYVKEGEKAWISEMYGWVYAVAKAGLEHKIDGTLQTYPSGDMRDIPKLIHYGLKHTILNYTFDKHGHYYFDMTMCPPWNLTMDRPQFGQGGDGGLFAHPPYPSEVPTEGKSPGQRYGELLNIEFVNTINLALCERHRSKCPESPELILECNHAEKIAHELHEIYEEYDKIICEDKKEECQEWAKMGSCDSEWMTMNWECRQSCGLCRHPEGPLHANALGTVSANDLGVVPVRDADQGKDVETPTRKHIPDTQEAVEEIASEQSDGTGIDKGTIPQKISEDSEQGERTNVTTVNDQSFSSDQVSLDTTTAYSTEIVQAYAPNSTGEDHGEHTKPELKGELGEIVDLKEDLAARCKEMALRGMVKTADCAPFTSAPQSGEISSRATSEWKVLVLGAMVIGAFAWRRYMLKREKSKKAVL